MQMSQTGDMYAIQNIDQHPNSRWTCFIMHYLQKIPNGWLQCFSFTSTAVHAQIIIYLSYQTDLCTSAQPGVIQEERPLETLVIMLRYDT